MYFRVVDSDRSYNEHPHTQNLNSAISICYTCFIIIYLLIHSSIHIFSIFFWWPSKTKCWTLGYLPWNTSLTKVQYLFIVFLDKICIKWNALILGVYLLSFNKGIPWCNPNLSHDKDITITPESSLRAPSKSIPAPTPISQSQPLMLFFLHVSFACFRISYKWSLLSMYSSV